MVVHQSHLFSPVTIGGQELANRIVMAPMTRARSGKDRIPNPLMAEYYSQRASAGLIISEATVISEQAIGWVDSPGIYTDAMCQGWQQVVGQVHDRNGKIYCQLWHTGRASHSTFHQGALPVAPSAIAIDGVAHTPKGKQAYETPRPLEIEELPGIVEDYARAARLARQAGFDGVEVHAANGYLLDQFLQSKTNHRLDGYGGNVENRYRLLGEVMDAVTSEWPANRVAVRLSPNGSFNDMGSTNYVEQFSDAAQRLDRYGLAYLHVMDGTGFGYHELGPAMTLHDFRKWFSGPIIGNVGYTQKSAEAAIATGGADLIAFGRPFISNSDLVARFAQGLPLAPEADMSVWYSHGAEGYTDFPTHPAT